MMGAPSDLTCDMCVANLEIPEPHPRAWCDDTPVVRADVRERLFVGQSGLHRTARGPALSMERTVSIGRVSWVDAPGSVLIPRGSTGVSLAVGGVSPGPSDGLVGMQLLAACHLAAPARATVGSSTGSRAGHDLDAARSSDRWLIGLGINME